MRAHHVELLQSLGNMPLSAVVSEAVYSVMPHGCAGAPAASEKMLRCAAGRVRRLYAAIAAALFLGGSLYAFWRVGKSWPGVPPATDGIFHLKQASSPSKSKPRRVTGASTGLPGSVEVLMPLSAERVWPVFDLLLTVPCAVVRTFRVGLSDIGSSLFLGSSKICFSGAASG